MYRDITDFHINSRYKNGHDSKCKYCANRILKEYRMKNKNSTTHKYEKTKKGFLVRLYRNMKSRTLGIVKPHLYKGLEILSKEDFYSWSFKSKTFDELYNDWAKNDYCTKLTPSIDRVDSSKGYTLNNMAWTTHSENSRRGSFSKWRNR